MAEAGGCLRPQPTVLNPAARAGLGSPNRRRVGEPEVQRGPAGAVPALNVQLTHPAPGDPVTAALDAAARVRLLPLPPRIGARGEGGDLGAARIVPALMVSRAQPLTAS